MRRLIPLILSAVLALAPPATLSAKSQLSVVRVNCLLPDGKGEMKATGFIWPEPGQMVTALHAVAGCQNIQVYSQSAKDSTFATDLLAVDLEGDLALLKLENDLGLQPVPHAVAEPDVNRSFKTWGYPLVQRRIIGHKIEFGEGLESNVTTIGKAFESEELQELFRNQDYPNKKTQILRITSTIQPGHSGAPIFDEHGHVVAIADGGLLGGFKGVNWSIPAHLYLPGLPTSDDPIPDEVSNWAGLFSATAPASGNFETSGTVFSGEPAQTASLDPDLVDQPTQEQRAEEDAWEPVYWGDPVQQFGEDGPWLLRQVSLREALAYHESLSDVTLLTDPIYNGLYDDAQLDGYWFDIYMDPDSGATLALPGWMEHQWVAESGYIWSYTMDGLLGMTTVVRPEQDFHAAVDEVYYYADWVNTFAQWHEDQPADFEWLYYDDTQPYADHFGWFRGWDDNAGKDMELFVTTFVSDVTFIGQSINFQPYEPDPTVDELMQYDVAALGARTLSQVWPDEDWAWEWDRQHDASDDDGWDLHDLGDDSDLSLVRQLSLRQALDYVAYIDAEDPIIQDIEDLLWDDGLKDDIWFSVYEDQLTGATVAVPSWISMEWDNDAGQLWAYNHDDTLEMSIAVLPGETFGEAVDMLYEHVADLDHWADWLDGRPTDFAWEYYSEEDQYASHSGFYFGAPMDGQSESTMLMTLAVSGDVFLGSTVFMLPAGEEPTDEELLEAMMMDISARYLTDFAVF